MPKVVDVLLDLVAWVIVKLVPQPHHRDPAQTSSLTIHLGTRTRPKNNGKAVVTSGVPPAHPKKRRRQ